MKRLESRLLCFVTVIGLFALGAIPGGAQVVPLPAANPSTHSDSFFAVAGEPFGVATMAIPVGVIEKGRLPRVLVSDSEGRVFYPEINLEELSPPSPSPSAGPTPRRIGRGGLCCILPR